MPKKEVHLKSPKIMPIKKRKEAFFRSLVEFRNECIQEVSNSNTPYEEKIQYVEAKSHVDWLLENIFHFVIDIHAISK